MCNRYYISHHGIEGQRWGVRNGPPYPLNKNKSNNSIKKNRKDELFKEKVIKGDKTDLVLRNEPITVKFLSKLIPSMAKNMSSWRDYTISDSYNKTIGNLTLEIKSQNELNIVWISIKKSERNKGYGQSVLKSLIEKTRNEGFKEVTLEVPDDDLNARHIYEKYGFVYDGKIGDLPGEEDDLWTGLNKMKLKL